MTLRSSLLWILAFLLMAGSVVYQRATGPTHPKRGAFAWEGQVHRYKLLRSETTDTEARITLPDPDPAATGRLLYRRYPTQDPWTSAPLQRMNFEGKSILAGILPRLPAAGKMEYTLELDGPRGRIQIPGQEPVILRYKDPVPAAILLAHVVFMFFGVLVGLRTGLAALSEPTRIKAFTYATLLLLTVGGMVLGPIVQKYAFGAYWTGWPFGGDLTDNKTLFMWAAWIVAALAIRFWPHEPLRQRWTLALATVVMITVYLIPHSLRGSELDHQQQKVTTGAR